MPISAIIVEDSDIYRRVLDELVSKIDDIELLGTASNFDDGQKLLTNHIPDLLLLDIEIGEVTSFELLPFVHESTRVIFITSHPEYAVKAFEINAVDYIIKPVTEARLRESINRVLSKDAAVQDSVQEGSKNNHRIIVNKEDRMFLIQPEEISYVEALGNYVKIHTNDDKQFVKYGTIKSWLSRLPDADFIQIHRSTIINLKQVERIEKWTNDTGRVYLKNKENHLDISRNYFQKLRHSM